MTLELRPLHREFGAEIIGVDLTQELAPSLFDEIEAAYYEYGLLLFVGQRLAPASQAALTRRFDGMDEAETETLVMTLVAHATQKERVYRHRWRVGDLMIWDNRAMMHSATEVESYEADRRLMHRSSALARPPGEAALRVGRIAA